MFNTVYKDAIINRVKMLSLMDGFDNMILPYAQKLAHKNCKISDEELRKMVSLLGLSNTWRDCNW